MGILRLLVLVYIVAIVGVIVLSWLPHEPETAAGRLFGGLRRATDPVLLPLRRVIPPVGGVVDLSPTIVLFALLVLYGAL